MKVWKSRRKRAIVGAIVAIAAGIILAVFGGFNHPAPHPGTMADLQGKWAGDLVWKSAAPDRYNKTLHTACTFTPDGKVDTVFRFPTGAVGGTGRYALKGNLLTVTCTGLNIDGRALPMTMFSHYPWFHRSATYQVSWDHDNLMLSSPDPARPQPAVAYPLLASPTPIVLEPSGKYLAEHPKTKLPEHKVYLSGEGEG